MHTYIYIHTPTTVYAYIYMYVYIYICADIRTYIYTCGCRYASNHISKQVFIYTCMQQLLT